MHGWNKTTHDVDKEKKSKKKEMQALPSLGMSLSMSAQLVYLLPPSSSSFIRNSVRTQTGMRQERGPPLFTLLTPLTLEKGKEEARVSEGMIEGPYHHPHLTTVSLSSPPHLTRGRRVQMLLSPSPPLSLLCCRFLLPLSFQEKEEKCYESVGHIE